MNKKFCFLGIIAILAACSTDALNDSDFLAGETFTDSNIRVMLLDTITVQTSTMKFDSIGTSEATRMLVGKYSDPVFGTMRSASHIEFLPESYTVDSEAQYDSIVFVLKYDNYYYNDTLKTNTIVLKELVKELKPEGDTFYNSSFVESSEEVVGSVAYTPRPLGSDSLNINISDTLGAALFEALQQKTIVNSEEFTDFFKGFSVQPAESDNGSIIGFSLASSYMRLYFSETEEDGLVEDYLDFQINTSDSPVHFFNRITSEDPNDYLKSLTNQEMNINSSVSNNQSFIQSGIGIATRIQFPHIKSVHDIGGKGTLLDAVLKIKPAIGSYNDKLMLRDTLNVYLVDRNNDLTEQLFVGGVAAVQAILNRDNQEFNDIYYEIHLSSYIEKLLVTDMDTEEALILLPDNYNATVDRFVMNGNTNADYPTTLELTYAIYDED